MRRIVSALALLVGLALLASAFLAAPEGRSATEERVLRLNVNSTDITYLDPALNYDFYGWRLEAATCAMLLGYPDKAGRASSRLYPEVATGFPKVSGDGKTYTYTLRSGFRFSDGTPVTAASYVRAIERALSPKMQSPAATFFSDIAGADKVMAGKATRPSGVTASGNKLTIRLTKVAPDFVSRMAMNFMCAIPPNLPIDPKGVNTPPGAGPYYVSSKIKGTQIVLRKNPYYGGTRKQNWDVIRVTVEMGEQASYLQVRKGEADLDLYSLPTAAHTQLTKEFGINKGRYFVHPSNSISYFALNTSRGLFKSAKARQAVAWAVDRPALTRLAGLNAGTPNEQILPPGIPGYRDVDIYPVGRPNLARAKALLGGTTGKVVMYTTNDQLGVNTGQLLQANLKAIGIDVEVKPYTFAVLIDKAGTRGDPFDIVSIGWFADYPDPYDFINILLDGRTIVDKNNVVLSYFHSPAYERKMDRAQRLTGDARYRAYGDLDIDITRNQSPLVITNNQNIREFISTKVGCPTYSFAWGGLNLVMLCPKR
ncbi:MAG TPA: ABC transporter substrate-binding protein [Gaiella sp.]|jgi:ABC-type transport system substrate-binding protein|nr:ABC transporter substrate-binding protein [Gaiella sp.]